MGKKAFCCFSYQLSVEFNNANITPDPGLFYRLKQPGPYPLTSGAFPA